MTNTPALTAEQRALKIWSDCVRLPKGGPVALIASAIREAEDAAYEQAAVVCESRAWANHDGVMPSGSCLNDALSIRALKSQKETP